MMVCGKKKIRFLDSSLPPFKPDVDVIDREHNEFRSWGEEVQVVLAECI